MLELWLCVGSKSGPISPCVTGRPSGALYVIVKERIRTDTCYILMAATEEGICLLAKKKADCMTTEKVYYEGEKLNAHKVNSLFRRLVDF